jgi:hypothetical protein
MQPSPHSALADRATPEGWSQAPGQAAELVYEGVTIVAMLLLLCSLWVF